MPSPCNSADVMKAVPVTGRSMATGLPESAKESGIRREYGNKLVGKKIPNEPLSTAVFDTLTYLLDKR